MSSIEVNDENRGVCPRAEKKHRNTSEDIFELEQPTGRPSILRQTENLPSMTLPKGMKVCFQTPQRDPITKRILSPTKVVNMASVDECIQAMGSLNLDLTNTVPPQTPTQPGATTQELYSYPDDDMPIRSKGGYQLDFDNLDSINPFTGSNKMPFSPPKPSVEKPSPKKLDHQCEEPTKRSDSALDETLPFTHSVENSLVNSSAEVSSTDSSVVTVVKVPAVEQESRSATPVEVPTEMSPRVDENHPSDGFVEDAPLPAKGSYNFDIDAVDPFKTEGSKIQNSPVMSRKAQESEPPTEEAQIKAADEEVLQVPVQTDVIATVTLTPPCTQGPDSDPLPAAPPTNEGPLKLEFNFDDGKVKQKPPPKMFGRRPPGRKPNTKAPANDTDKSCANNLAEQKPQHTDLPNSTEVFVSGTEFMSNNFEGQIDYLEQFGSTNFKESALRKQSLYLKFDPLLRESPKKCAGSPGFPLQAPHPTALVSRLETLPAAEDSTAASTPQILGSLVPPFTQPPNTEDIIDVLKYSQRDMDAAIAKIQAEAKEKEDLMCAKYNELKADGQEMRKIVAEFELLIAKMNADQEMERQVSQTKLDEVMLEKEQLASDLNAMERSLSDLLRRLDKYKEILEGYKKNEETLKACAQDYFARIKKEEKRYETLKAHAEEKINQANEVIAEVRSKNKAEVAALQVQLRREQVKVHSLEKNLDQKVKEAEELTKLCDELISNVQNG